MSRVDAFVNKLPGSLPFKAFCGAMVLCAITAYPVFKQKPEDSRQGHDYMSSEKPEQVKSTQEQLRKEYRRNRDKAVNTTTDSEQK